MCGRFTLPARMQAIADEFGLQPLLDVSPVVNNARTESPDCVRPGEST